MNPEEKEIQLENGATIQYHEPTSDDLRGPEPEYDALAPLEALDNAPSFEDATDAQKALLLAEAQKCGVRDCRARNNGNEPRDPKCMVIFTTMKNKTPLGTRRKQVNMATDLRVCAACRENKRLVNSLQDQFSDQFMQFVFKNSGGKKPKKIYVGWCAPENLSPLPDMGPDVEAEITFADPTRGTGVPRLLGPN